MKELGSDHCRYGASLAELAYDGLGAFTMVFTLGQSAAAAVGFRIICTLKHWCMGRGFENTIVILFNLGVDIHCIC